MTTSIITRGSGVSIAGRQSRGLSPAFSRASAAYQSDGRLVGVGVPRFEMVGGRRGVLVEEGTTNFSPALAANQNVTLTDVGDGWKRCMTNQTTSTPGVTTGLFDAAAYAGKTITVSIEARHTGASPRPSLYVRAYRADGSISATLTLGSIYVSVEPTRLVFTGTLPADTSRLNGGILWSSPQMGDWFEYRNWQVEQKPYATSFVDGTRANDVLTLSTAVLGVRDEGPWSLECWAQTSIAASVWRMVMDAWPKFYVGISPSGQIGVSWKDGTQKVYYGPVLSGPSDWHHWVITYDGANCRVHVDGVSVLDNPGNLSASFPGVIRIASAYGLGSPWNGHVQQFRIHPRALSDEEIAAHAAGNIVAGDCYHYPFDGDLWPAPGSLGAVVAPAVATRPGRIDVVTRGGSVDIITRPGKLEVVKR